MASEKGIFLNDSGDLEINAGNISVDSAGSIGITGSLTVNARSIVAGITAGGAAGQVLAKKTTADYDVEWITPSGGGGTPGGSTNQVQYNNAGSFAGSSDLELFTGGSGRVQVNATLAVTGPTDLVGALGITGAISAAGLFSVTGPTATFNGPSGSAFVVNQKTFFNTLGTAADPASTYALYVDPVTNQLVLPVFSGQGNITGNTFKTNPGFNAGGMVAIAAHPTNGYIYMDRGNATLYNGTTLTSSIITIDSSGNYIDFMKQSNSAGGASTSGVTSFSFFSDGSLLVIGSFTSWTDTIGTVTCSGVMKISATGTIDRTYMANVGAGYNSAPTQGGGYSVILPDGRAAITTASNTISSFSGDTIYGLVVIAADGTKPTYGGTPSYNAFVSAGGNPWGTVPTMRLRHISLLSGGDIVCSLSTSGTYTFRSGASSTGTIIRLETSDFTISSSWTTTSAFTQVVRSMSVDTTVGNPQRDKIYVLGTSLTRRLNTNGSSDAAFTPALGGFTTFALNGVKMIVDSLGNAYYCLPAGTGTSTIAGTTVFKPNPSTYLNGSGSPIGIFKILANGTFDTSYGLYGSNFIGFTDLVSGGLNNGSTLGDFCLDSSRNSYLVSQSLDTYNGYFNMLNIGNIAKLSSAGIIQNSPYSASQIIQVPVKTVSNFSTATGNSSFFPADYFKATGAMFFRSYGATGTPYIYDGSNWKEILIEDDLIPIGASGQIQYNLGSSLGATSAFVFNSGTGSLEQGQFVSAQGPYSHAEGIGATAGATGSHVEGYRNMTSNGASGSHAEGIQTTTVGPYSHSEGAQTVSIGQASHVEGQTSTAIGNYSHAEGLLTTTKGAYSFAVGKNTLTGADYQVVLGYGNAESSTTFNTVGYKPFIVGAGAEVAARANIFEIVVTTASGAGNSGRGTLVLPTYNTLNFTSDANAAAANVPLGGLYHNAGAARIRVS